MGMRVYACWVQYGPLYIYTLRNKIDGPKSRCACCKWEVCLPNSTPSVVQWDWVPTSWNLEWGISSIAWNAHVCSWVELGNIQQQRNGNFFNLQSCLLICICSMICRFCVLENVSQKKNETNCEFPGKRAPICKPIHSSLSYFSSVFFKNGQDTMLFTNHQQSLSSGGKFQGHAMNNEHQRFVRK